MPSSGATWGIQGTVKKRLRASPHPPPPQQGKTNKRWSHVRGRSDHCPTHAWPGPHAPHRHCTVQQSLSFSLTHRDGQKRNKERERERSFSVYLSHIHQIPPCKSKSKSSLSHFPSLRSSVLLSTISHLISLISLLKKQQPYFRLLQPDDEVRFRVSVTLFNLQGNASKPFVFFEVCG